MRQTTFIPRELQERANRELEPGERIQWMDMPVPRVFTRATTGAFLFAIPWTAFAVFWVCAAAGFKIPDFSRGGFAFFPLFGVPFVLIGLAMLAAPLLGYRKALRTVYMITDRRAVVLYCGRTTAIQSYSADQVKEFQRKAHTDGTGDIVFGRRPWRTSKGAQRFESLGFFYIKNAEQVEQLLAKLAAPPLPKKNFGDR